MKGRKSRATLEARLKAFKDTGRGDVHKPGSNKKPYPKKRPERGEVRG